MRPGAAVLALFLASTLAANPRLVHDFNTTVAPQGSNPQFWTTVGNLTFLSAFDGERDLLWVTDGTTGGTRTAGTSLHQRVTAYLGTLGNSVIYSGVQHGGSNAIFITDGSFSGTRFLAFAAGRFPLGTYRGVTYFAAATSQHGEELWRTDGTAEGTYVVDLEPGSASSAPRLMTVAGDKMLFFANTAVNFGWHRSDGTVAGTTLLSRGGSYAVGVAGDKVIALRDGGPTTQYWVSDGTAGGTMLLAETPDLLSVATILGSIGNRVLFTRAGADGSWDVWTTDGTIAGTTFVFDIPPGAQVFHGTVVGERIFFIANEDGGSAVYVTDGTGAGTARVRWFEDRTSISGTEAGGAYLFMLHGESERTLWRSDGTEGGTTQLAVVGERSYSSYFFIPVRRAGGALFTGHDTQHGDEPWITDGTPGGTHLLANLRPERQNWGSPFGLAAGGSRLFLQATDGATRGLYMVENGTPVRIAESTREGSGRGAVFSGGLYYFTQGGLPNIELWRTDGTAAGTFRLHTMQESRYIELMLPLRGGLLFQGHDAQHGAEPWFTDGTVAGTRMLADTDPFGSGFAYPSAVIRANGTAALLSGRKIWITDGTTATAIESPDGDITEGSPLAEMGGVVYALDDMHSNAFGLWRSDGVETRRVVEIEDSRVNAGWLWSTGTRLFFLGSDAVWTSDGTQAGTRMLRHVSPTTCSPPDPPTGIVANGVFYWYGQGLPAGLWRSDGTVEGTYVLAEFPTGGYVCNGHLAAAGNTIYFRGYDEATGFELWRTDGTVRGTRIVSDLEPGPADSDPRELTLAGEELYLVATTSAVGQELFVLSTTNRERRRSVRH